MNSVAYHEAGHAVTSFILNSKIYRVSIEPQNGSAGNVWSERLVNHSIEYDNSCRNQCRVERKIMILLAGHEAQKMFRPSSIRRHHRASDMQAVANLLSRIAANGEEQDAYMRLLRIRTRNLLSAKWHCVQAVAKPSSPCAQ
jgi:ATP-dependent Zn protease